MNETHHTQKLDTPSGTAISLAQGIINEVERIEHWKLVKNFSEEIPSNHLPIEAHRIDQVPGTHEIIYYSEVDEIRIVHEAKSRKGFAEGAILAAEWLVGKKGVFTMRDFLNL
jgi:4-hydroxy-tetrahydrodipicolinate reductase